MQMVIDIPKEIVDWVNDYSFFIRGFNGEKIGTIADAIKNGVPLPKGHGRLIDADALVRKAYEEAQGMTNNNFGTEVEWLVDKTPTLIEADKEGSEDEE